MKRELTKQLLAELLKDSKRSDRELAKVLGVSQPTVTRRRHDLVQEGVIREFTILPDFAKLGFEIMAFSFYSWTSEANQALTQNRAEILEQLAAFLAMHPNIVFTANGHGFKMERMMISLHKNYTDYAQLMNKVQEEWGRYLDKSVSFIVSLEGDVVGRHLGFKNLGKVLQS